MVNCPENQLNDIGLNSPITKPQTDIERHKICYHTAWKKICSKNIIRQKWALTN